METIFHRNSERIVINMRWVYWKSGSRVENNPSPTNALELCRDWEERTEPAPASSQIWLQYPIWAYDFTFVTIQQNMSSQMKYIFTHRRAVILPFQKLIYTEKDIKFINKHAKIYTFKSRVNNFDASKKKESHQYILRWNCLKKIQTFLN